MVSGDSRFPPYDFVVKYRRVMWTSKFTAVFRLRGNQNAILHIKSFKKIHLHRSIIYRVTNSLVPITILLHSLSAYLLHPFEVSKAVDS